MYVVAVINVYRSDSMWKSLSSYSLTVQASTKWARYDDETEEDLEGHVFAPVTYEMSEVMTFWSTIFFPVQCPHDLTCPIRSDSKKPCHFAQRVQLALSQVLVLYTIDTYSCRVWLRTTVEASVCTFSKCLGKRLWKRGATYIELWICFSMSGCLNTCIMKWSYCTVVILENDLVLWADKGLNKEPVDLSLLTIGSVG